MRTANAMPAYHLLAAVRRQGASTYHAEEGSEVGSEFTLHAICQRRCHDGGRMM